MGHSGAFLVCEAVLSQRSCLGMKQIAASLRLIFYKTY